jgi:proteasome alpha subunit
VKILLTELGQKPGKDIFLVINYDGTFEEGPHCAVLAASKSVEQDMLTYLRKPVAAALSLEQAVGTALQAWALGDRSQRKAKAAENGEGTAAGSPPSDAATLYAHVREIVAEKTIECAVLDRTQPGSSKYRALTAEELGRLLPQDIKRSLP